MLIYNTQIFNSCWLLDVITASYKYKLFQISAESENVMVSVTVVISQVFLVRKIRGVDRGQLYAMKVLKKATLKGKHENIKLQTLWHVKRHIINI